MFLSEEISVVFPASVTSRLLARTGVARALIKAHRGDIVELRAPAGIEQIEVLAIRYGVADSKTG